MESKLANSNEKYENEVESIRKNWKRWILTKIVGYWRNLCGPKV